MLGALTDVGNVRQINEDYLSFYEDEDICVYIIADGIGGHNAGEIASVLAIEKTIEYLKEHKYNKDLEVLLKESIAYANRCVYKRSEENSNLKGMGTTITAFLTDWKKYVVANVGDSSCYAIKDKEIAKITKDHSLVQQLVDEGSITEMEAKHHPNKNVITRALGTSYVVDIDTFEIQDSIFDKIILCTDGLTDEVQPEEINLYIQKYGENMEVCRELINLAKERGGKDNITVMVIEGKCNNDRNHIK